MRALLLLMLLVSPCLAQPADCPAPAANGPMLPLQLDLAGRPGVPRGVTGQAFVAVPLTPQGNACHDAPPPPKDVLRGAPSDDLLKHP
jgi:hypothetical protein